MTTLSNRLQEHLFISKEPHVALHNPSVQLTYQRRPLWTLRLLFSWRSKTVFSELCVIDDLGNLIRGQLCLEKPSVQHQAWCYVIQLVMFYSIMRHCFDIIECITAAQCYSMLVSRLLFYLSWCNDGRRGKSTMLTLGVQILMIPLVYHKGKREKGGKRR